MDQKIAVCGAGTMGSGIAQVAAQSGFKTILFDVNEAALDNARAYINKGLDYLLSKEKISAEERQQIFSNIEFTSNPDKVIADLIIEAIIEDHEAKRSLFTKLAAINSQDTILASNTSSLSVTEIQAGIPHPERVAGLHFFNPAPVMKLVEVIKGEQTGDAIINTLRELCIAMGKTPVVCKDSPGFIVNRVARHYYLEALKLVEEGVAGFEDVDEIMEATGFRMGPFRLMDLIGMDINLAVSESLYDAFNKVERFRPSSLQAAKVKAGELGRKTGKGFYDYNRQDKNK